MTTEAEKATANLAVVGVLQSPPSQRELQLAALNELLLSPGAPRDDNGTAVRAVVHDLSAVAIADLMIALSTLQAYLADEVAERDGFVRGD